MKLLPFTLRLRRFPLLTIVAGQIRLFQSWIVPTPPVVPPSSQSSQDILQRMVISYALDLPFRRGKKYLSDVHGVAGGAISGWGLDGVTSLQRGFPIKISDGKGNSPTALSLGTGT